MVYPCLHHWDFKFSEVTGPGIRQQSGIFSVKRTVVSTHYVRFGTE